MGGSCRWKRLMRGSSQPNGSPVPPYGGGGEVCFFIHYRQNFAHAQFCHFPRQGKAIILPYFRGFPLPEKKFSKLHFFRQKCSASFKPSPCLLKILLTKFSSAKMLSLFQRLPLGGKLRLKVGGEGRNLFSISISLSDNVPAPCFSEISPEIFRKSKMCYAPHSLRFRSAPSPRGEGYNIALFQRLPLGGKLSLEATDEGQFATE